MLYCSTIHGHCIVVLDTSNFSILHCTTLKVHTVYCNRAYPTSVLSHDAFSEVHSMTPLITMHLDILKMINKLPILLALCQQQPGNKHFLWDYNDLYLNSLVKTAPDQDADSKLLPSLVRSLRAFRPPWCLCTEGWLAPTVPFHPDRLSSTIT